MRKVNLFRIVLLFASIAWLELFSMKPGFAYACWIFIIQVIFNIFYEVLEKDYDNDSNLDEGF